MWLTRGNKKTEIQAKESDVIEKTKSLEKNEIAMISKENQAQNSSIKLRIIILGPTASGKAELCNRVSENYDVVHVSSGSMIRNVSRHAKRGTKWYRCKNYARIGRLIPDSLANSLVEEKLFHDDAKEKGFVLNGFPRTLEQVKFLQQNNFLEKSICIKLKISDRTVRRTLFKRRNTKREAPQIDTPKNIRFRLWQYSHLVEDVVSELSTTTKIVEIDTDKSSNVFEEVKKAIDLHDQEINASTSDNVVSKL